MKSPAKNIMIAIISGILFTNAGFSFAKSYEVNFYNQEIQVNKKEDNTERRHEFWEKFRESVTPREKDPPREVTPEEVHNEEVDKKEVK